MSNQSEENALGGYEPEQEATHSLYENNGSFDINNIPDTKYADWFGAGGTREDILEAITYHGVPVKIYQDGYMSLLVYQDKAICIGYDGYEYWHNFIGDKLVWQAALASQPKASSGRDATALNQVGEDDKIGAIKDLIMSWRHGENLHETAIAIESLFHTNINDKYKADNTQIIADFKSCVEALRKASSGLVAADAMLPYSGKLLSMAHASVDESKQSVDEALTLAEKYKQLFEGVK